MAGAEYDIRRKLRKTRPDGGSGARTGRSICAAGGGWRFAAALAPTIMAESRPPCGGSASQNSCGER